MTKMKLFIAAMMFLGVVGVGQAAQVSQGAYPVFMTSSGTVVVGQGALWGVSCSSAGAAAQNLNTLFVQYFLTAPAVGGTGVYTTGGINMTSISSGNVLTPQIVVASSNTTGIGGNMFVGADYSSFGGIHFDTGLYFYMSPASLGAHCVTLWKRD